MGFWLEIHEGGRVEVREIAGAELIIGRSDESDVVLADRRSSRKHCRLQRTPQGLLLEDLESSNGTLLNGYTVKKSFVKSGDEFRVGSVRFVVVEGDQPPRGAGASATSGDAATPAEKSVDSPGTVTPPPQAPPAPQRRAAARPDPGDDGSGGAEDGLLEWDGEEAEEEAPSPKRAAPRPPSPKPPTAATAKPAGNAAVPPEASLEWMQGPQAGSKVSIDKTPFFIGRSRKADLTVSDQKASSLHAKITRDQRLFRLEDLGSTNGTLVNKHPVKQVVLVPGCVLQIGDVAFRVHVPRPAAEDVGAAAQAGDEFVQFDIDEFLARGKAQHPLTVIALVLIFVVVGYFAVDVTRRLVIRPEIDPPAEGNLVLENWSFEAEPEAPSGAASPSPSAVSGWTLRSWPVLGPDEGVSEGSMESTQAFARMPGRRAMRLAGSVPSRITLASQEIRMGVKAGEPYRLEGHVTNENALAAGYVIEWQREVRGERVLLAMSLSETARSPRESMDVDETLLAPSAAMSAVVSCFVLGTGSAVFDRISLSEASASLIESDVESEDGSPIEPVDPEGDLREFALPGERSSSLTLKLVAKANGTFAVERARRQELLPGLWIGLGLEQDPLALGPRIAAPQAVESETNALLFLCDLPDQSEARWVAVETKATSGRGRVGLRWRTASSAEEARSASLVFFFETFTGRTPVELHTERGMLAFGREERLTDSVEGVREVVIGERDERVSLLFGTPLNVGCRSHPVDSTRSLWFAEVGQGTFELNVERGSRQESLAAASDLERAESLFLAGKVSQAFSALQGMRSRYPDQEGIIRQAEERLAEWNKSAAEWLLRLKAELLELRRVPTAVLHGSLVRRVAAFEEKYGGTGVGSEASALQKQIQDYWKGLESKQTAKELRELYDRGKRHFDLEELSLAELYLRFVAKADSDEELRKEAENALKMIEARRERNIQLILK